MAEGTKEKATPKVIMTRVANHHSFNKGNANKPVNAIKEWGAELFPDAKVILTGTLCQFTQIQDYVSWGQVQSVFMVISARVSVLTASIWLRFSGRSSSSRDFPFGKTK